MSGRPLRPAGLKARFDPTGVPLLAVARGGADPRDMVMSLSSGVFVPQRQSARKGHPAEIGERLDSPLEGSAARQPVGPAEVMCQTILTSR